MKMLINPFEDKKSQSKPELEEKVRLERDPQVLELIDIWQSLPEGPQADEYITLDMPVPVLTPAQIDQFLLSALRDYRHLLGYYINNLMKEAYKEGHRHFTLNAGDHELDFIGTELKGEYVIDIRGHAGYPFAEEADGVTFNVYGETTPMFGQGASNCIFNLYGREKVRGWPSDTCTYATPYQAVFDALRTFHRQDSSKIRLIDLKGNTIKEVSR